MFHQPLGADNLGHQIQTHGMKFFGRCLEIVLDFLQAKGIGGGFIPIGLAVIMTPAEADLLSFAVPVGARGKIQPFHRLNPKH